MSGSRCIVPALTVLLAAALPRVAVAGAEVPDRREPLPRELEGIGITEHLGEHVPLDLPFTDESGAPVTLRGYLAGGLPVVLTFNYSNCPVLCSTQLDFLAHALAELGGSGHALPILPGRQYEVITVSLDPSQTGEQSRHMRETYVRKFPEAAREDVRSGWHFITGSEQTVRALASAVGYQYSYLPDRNEYVHPAAVMFLSADGTIIRYVKGLEYPPELVNESIWAAGTGSPRNSVGFVQACFHYDPKAGSHAASAQRAMKYGAAGFLVLLLVVFAAWHHVRTRRAREESSPA